MSPERTVPHDLDAEKAVLGAALVHPELLDEVTSYLRPSDFFRDAHRQIFGVMVSLHAQQTTPDFLTVKDRLAAAGELDGVGGPAYLAALTDGIPRSINVRHYAAIVREKATRRQLIQAANVLRADAYASDDAAADVLNRTQQALFDIAEHQLTGEGFAGMPLVMADVMAMLEARVSRPHELTGVPSGFGELDAMTGGFQAGDLIIIAARPSMGKTSFAQAIAVHAAHRDRITALFSVEMSRQSLGLRLLASEARIDAARVRNGALRDAEWRSVSQAMERLSAAGLFIDDASDLTIFDVRARTRRLRAERGVGLVIVDYLQLMRAAEKAENKNLEVAAISRGLKLIARDLQVPVVVLSQLSRDSEKRADKRPMLSDLRDSGALEQDADVVLFLHREEYYTPREENRGVADVIVAKQRNGPTGTIRLVWHEHLTRFENVPARSERPPYVEHHR